MISLTEKDLVSEILMNKDYDWRFILDNPPRISNLEGNLLLSSGLHNRDFPESKISIINNKDIYYIVAQIHLSKLRQLRLVDYKTDYSEKYHTDRLTTITDIYDPYYNVEWCFKIEEELWKTIYETLVKVEMPLRFVGPPEHRKTLWFKHSNDHILFDWHTADPRSFDLETFMYSLVDIALEKVSIAYIRR